MGQWPATDCVMFTPKVGWNIAAPFLRTFFYIWYPWKRIWSQYVLHCTQAKAIQTPDAFNTLSVRRPNRQRWLFVNVLSDMKLFSVLIHAYLEGVLTRLRRTIPKHKRVIDSRLQLTHSVFVSQRLWFYFLFDNVIIYYDIISIILMAQRIWMEDLDNLPICQH